MGSNEISQSLRRFRIGQIRSQEIGIGQMRSNLGPMRSLAEVKEGPWGPIRKAKVT